MELATERDWETLATAPHFTLRRSGRYLVAALAGEHAVMSTSVRNGGRSQAIRYLANHQSCEASTHTERHSLIHGMGLEAYHDVVCQEMGLPPDAVALMGTAANMNYAAVCTCEDHSISVTAVVTGGVQGNATCAGDPALWREGDDGWEKVDGTINTMLLINHALTDGALARVVMTMTEAKSAALQQLSIGSRYSQDFATGTGTDQFAIAAAEVGRVRLSSASPHIKLGELIGRAVRTATLEALRWQNGLEPSYTRSLFAALGRFGLHEETIFDQMAPLLDARALALMQNNRKSVFCEPLVAGAAYALAAVLDRARFGTLPEHAAREALRQQAASLAASLSAKPHLWNSFRTQLDEPDPLRLVIKAMALGWTAKWTS